MYGICIAGHIHYHHYPDPFQPWKFLYGDGRPGIFSPI